MPDSNDYGSVDHCTCKKYAYDSDECPYSSEIDGESSLCTCCPYCRDQCAGDI